MMWMLGDNIYQSSNEYTSISFVTNRYMAWNKAITFWVNGLKINLDNVGRGVLNHFIPTREAWFTLKEAYNEVNNRKNCKIPAPDKPRFQLPTPEHPGSWVFNKLLDVGCFNFWASCCIGTAMNFICAGCIRFGQSQGKQWELSGSKHKHFRMIAGWFS